MAQKPLEERIEELERRLNKIDGYGKMALGAFGALSVVGAFFNWIVDKFLRLHQ